MNKQTENHESNVPLQSQLDVEGDGGAGVYVKYVQHLEAGDVVPQLVAGRTNKDLVIWSFQGAQSGDLEGSPSQLDRGRTPRSRSFARPAPSGLHRIDHCDPRRRSLDQAQLPDSNAASQRIIQDFARMFSVSVSANSSASASSWFARASRFFVLRSKVNGGNGTFWRDKNNLLSKVHFLTLLFVREETDEQHNAPGRSRVAYVTTQILRLRRGTYIRHVFTSPRSFDRARPVL